MYVNRVGLLLLIIQFFLAGCDCACGSTYNTTVPSNTTTIKSSVYVYGDGCAETSGQVNSSGYPDASCDGTGQYVNRGRWVKVPNVSVVTDSIVNIGIQGSIYYCSTGYDNQNISPYYIVSPGSNMQNANTSNLQLPLSSGQMVAIEVMPDDNSVSNYQGVALGNNASSVTTRCDAYPTSSQYYYLKQGACRGYNALGLTIYVGGTEIVNLDQGYSQNATYYPYMQSRIAFLYSYMDPNNRSEFYNYNYQRYQMNLSTNQGIGKYVFQVPQGVSGVLGFKIARGNISTGNGQYTLNVMTTSPVCYVVQSQAYSEPDNRGALELLVSSTNPNSIDNAIASFNALRGGDEITPYRQSLNQYIAHNLNITINTNVPLLSNLVVVPNLSPVVILAPSYNFAGGESGDIWLKVRDDYYSDNVGEYYVTATVTTTTAGVVSEFLTDLINPITDTIYSLSETLYRNFMTYHYLNIVRMGLLIYIMFYGVEFALGLVQISSQDLIIRILKLAVVIELFNPSSYEFFDRYFFEFFKSGSNTLTQYVTGDYTNSKAGMFGFLDDIFNVYFFSGTWIKLAALIPDIIGILLLMVVVYIICIYVLILSRVIISYLLVVVGVTLLVALAPMFFPLMLFERTKKYFDNWVKNLFGYAIQPVLLFGSLYIMTIIFLQLWNNLMDFDVCWGGVIDLYFPLYSWTQGFLPNVSLNCIQYFKVIGGINYINMFGGAFALLVFSLAINNMMSHIPEMSDSIAGVFTASAVSNKASETVQKGMDTVGKAAGAVASGANKLGNLASNLARRAGAGGGASGGSAAGSGASMGASTARGNKVGEMDQKKPRSKIGKALSAVASGVKAAGKGAVKSMIPEALKKDEKEREQGGDKLGALKALLERANKK